MIAEYKTIDEQVEILKGKNILFKNEEKAKKTLLKENYYNMITGYKDIFIDMKSSKKEGIDICDEETYFEEIYAVYRFDRDLRNIMFKYISIIETHVKGYISDVFSKKYGTHNYIKKENFYVGSSKKSQERYDKFIKIMQRDIDKKMQDYPDILNYKTENGDIPLWMLATLITFGSISQFYSFLKNVDKQEVANLANLNANDMQNYLRILGVVRNICAHNNILFNIKLDFNYYCEKTEKVHDVLGIAKRGQAYETGINDMVAVITATRKMLDDKEFRHFSTELVEIIDEIKEELDDLSFNNLLKTMGMQKNYRKLMEV